MLPTVTLMTTNDRATYRMTDDNECESGASTCPENTLCINTDGSYICRCEPGFEEDLVNKTCIGRWQTLRFSSRVLSKMIHAGYRRKNWVKSWQNVRS